MTRSKRDYIKSSHKKSEVKKKKKKSEASGNRVSKVLGMSDISGALVAVEWGPCGQWETWKQISKFIMCIWG